MTSQITEVCDPVNLRRGDVCIVDLMQDAHDGLQPKGAEASDPCGAMALLAAHAKVLFQPGGWLLARPADVAHVACARIDQNIDVTHGLAQDTSTVMAFATKKAGPISLTAP